ncbi:MAG TPA: hypothetical protein VJZ51_06410 [Bacilli bacterium]|nr:hypothetical protein [Bacilli bacterium]
MKKGLTEIVFILDRSGSMSGLEADTIGGFNSTLEKQKKLEGEAVISTILFDNNFEVLHNRVPLVEVQKMTKEDYFVRGSTALLDAIGRSIIKIGNIQKNTPEDYQAEKVLFVIITDGMENASREYNYETIKSMVEKQKEKYAWEFIFLGANIDAVGTAGRIGIGGNRASNYHADRRGVRYNYQSASSAITQLRKECKIDDNWSQEVEEDYQKRNAKEKGEK